MLQKGVHMSLAKLLKNQFSGVVRQRGEKYYSDKLVQFLSKNQNHARFLVSGSIPYTCHMEELPETKQFDLTCACKHFEDGFFCKHLWAVVLKADELDLFPPRVTAANTVPVAANENQDKLVDRTSSNLTTSSDTISNNTLSNTPVAEQSWRTRILAARENQTLEAQKKVRNSFSAFANPLSAKYAIDLVTSVRNQRIQIYFFTQERFRDGSLGSPRANEITHDMIDMFFDEQDQNLLWQLLGSGSASYTSLNNTNYGGGIQDKKSGVSIAKPNVSRLLEEISDAGKLGLLKRKEASVYSKEPVLDLKNYLYQKTEWSLQLRLKKFDDSYVLTPFMTDGQEKRTLQQVLGAAGPFIFFEDFVAKTDLHLFSAWLDVFKNRKELEIPESEVSDFLQFYFSERNPDLELPAELDFTASEIENPKVRITFLNVKNKLAARLQFQYGASFTDRRSHSQNIYDISKKQKHTRVLLFENQSYDQFLLLKPTLPADASEYDGFFSESEFLNAVRKSLELGWEVQANQKPVQVGKNFQMQINSSGLDWFDLSATFKFEGFEVKLPTLLQHLKSGDKFIKLGDSNFGILPDEWLAKFGPLAELGQITAEGLRLNKVQALFLSANLGADEAFQSDKKFMSLQSIVQELNENRSLTPPESFRGTLRTYQKQGLAWLHLLANQNIGGLLADDMGLGKTVQILSLLCMDSGGSEKKMPALIVAPKSLVFNWINEAKKFAPDLKVLDHTGNKRSKDVEEFKNYDVILSTYQTLRMDIELFRSMVFEFFILDEAHYIKNPLSLSFKACRLVNAKKKVALTGTPVENSLSDLLSILSVITPGLLSDAQINRWGKQKDPETLKILSKALRPFILRRTKQEVLKDLPEKMEQVLFCELSESERKRYDEMKQHYWLQLSEKVENKGFDRSKIDVLEALLRLRQAACHQGLLDEKKRASSSAKFELLLEQIEAVIQDGHKALVFSQFTTLLALLKTQLVKRNIAFEYLDGQTKDRQERVESFQRNDDIKLFLLSLKAGGVGLNLTAADYVFILDPWWNPAAEDQAIDRTHRIGQTKKVFAYKIIAKDTVEEKILELQKSKKALAKAVISNEKSVLKNLSLEDLQALFS